MAATKRVPTLLEASSAAVIRDIGYPETTRVVKVSVDMNLHTFAPTLKMIEIPKLG